MTPLKTPASFWADVDRSGGLDACWPWARKSRLPKGYGLVGYRRARWQSHRLAYFLATGHHPGKLCVMHHCDNPPCCNPAHLSLGTVRDNTLDMISKGRNRPARGERNANSRFTADEIMRLFLHPAPTRRTAIEFAVSERTVYDIRRGNTWRHVTNFHGPYLRRRS